MVLEDYYRRRRAPGILSFGFDDVLQQASVIRFYCTPLELSGGAAYYLTTNAMTPASIPSALGNYVTQSGTSTTTYTFDSPVFQVQQTVKGMMYFGCGYSHSAVAHDRYVKVQLFTVTGVTETQITSEVQSQTISIGTTTSTRELINLACTETVVKRGDLLRLKVTFYNSTGNLYIGMDPTNATFNGSTVGGMMFADIPFKINL